MADLLRQLRKSPPPLRQPRAKQCRQNRNQTKPQLSRHHRHRTTRSRHHRQQRQPIQLQARRALQLTQKKQGHPPLLSSPDTSRILLPLPTNRQIITLSTVIDSGFVRILFLMSPLQQNNSKLLCGSV